MMLLFLSMRFYSRQLPCSKSSFMMNRGAQKVSKTCIVISTVVWVSAVVCVIVAWPKLSWLRLISVFNLIQVFMAAIKYIPQAIMIFGRKSTEGWSIGKILLVLLGGLTNYAQLAVQSIDQHYVLYRPRDVKHLPEVYKETATVTTPLLKLNDAAQASNV